MRIPKKKVTARATALALGLGLIAVVLTALPAFATTPTITGLSVATGARGTAVTITGTDFQNPVVTGVTIGGAAATFLVTGATTITTTVPCAASSGVGQVRVTNADGTSPNNGTVDDFDVTASGAPTISSFTPTGGPVGTVVTITGTNLCAPTQVLFNATAATVFSATSATSISATVPTGATTGLLHVTTAVAPPAASATNFTVAGLPTITSFAPTTGNIGTSVVITGTNLLGVTAVKFNGVTATFTTSTATSVTATVPTGATTGKITVTTPGGTATSLTDFTVTTAPVTRSLSFGFEPHSRVSGQVSVSGPAACTSLVPVVIQKQKSGGWKWVDTTATTKHGSYKTYIPPSNGTFRAKINKITLANGVVCGGNTSNVVHVHG